MNQYGRALLWQPLGAVQCGRGYAGDGSFAPRPQPRCFCPLTRSDLGVCGHIDAGVQRGESPEGVSGDHTVGECLGPDEWPRYVPHEWSITLTTDKFPSVWVVSIYGENSTGFARSAIRSGYRCRSSEPTPDRRSPVPPPTAAA
ncbi:Uncharacterised protein [Mycobacteroides abscessus subsp. abscessus]|nr:Uncharacterised protein [Mycobacteroides abscessus subsp. abscessus]